MVQPYTYNVNDTSKGRVDNSTLDEEIKADATLAAEIAGGNPYLGSAPPDGGGDFIVYFSESITGIASLNAVVSAHTGNGHVPYDYLVSDTTNNSVHPVALDAEVKADATIASDPATYDGIIVHGSGAPSDAIDVVFSGDILPATKTALDAVIAAHDGTGPVSKSQVAKLSITSGVVTASAWATIGGAVIDSADYSPDPSKIRLSLYLSHKTTAGGGGELPQVRITELLSDGTTPIELLSATNLPSNGGAWHTHVIDVATAPRDGENQYDVELQLNGAASCDVRFGSLAVYRLG